MKTYMHYTRTVFIGLLLASNCLTHAMQSGDEQTTHDLTENRLPTAIVQQAVAAGMQWHNNRITRDREYHSLLGQLRERINQHQNDTQPTQPSEPLDR